MTSTKNGRLPHDVAMDNLLPADPAAERACLGSMLLDLSTYPAVAAVLVDGGAEFDSETHRHVYAAIEVFHRSGKPVDSHLLRTHFEAKGLLPTVNLEVIGGLLSAVASSTRAAHYAEIVHNAHVRRKTVAATHRLTSAACDPSSDLEKIRGEVVSELAALAIRGDSVRALTPEQLIQQYPNERDSIIDGVIRKGETGNLISTTKGCKSWMGIAKGISVAMGLPWLGYMHCNRGRVVLCDNELHRETLSKRVRIIAEAMSVNIGELSKWFHFLPLRGQQCDIHSIRRHLDAPELRGATFCIIDAAYRARPVGFNENDNAQMTEFYNSLDQYASELDMAFWLIGHCSKGNQSDKATTDVGAGAGAQSRTVDNHSALLPHKTEGVAVLQSKARSFPPIPPLALKWQFPLWTLDSESDPNELKPIRNATQTRAAKIAAEWTPERFVLELVKEPRQRPHLISEGTKRGLSRNRVDALIAECQSLNILRYVSRTKDAPARFERVKP